MFVVHSVL